MNTRTHLTDALEVGRDTPVTEARPGRAMTKTRAGGHAFEITDAGQLDRWLILGSDSTYYATGAEMTAENMGTVKAAIAADPTGTIDRIVAVSDSGRAARNTPALYALAVAATDDRDHVRGYAHDALPKVARTGTMLFEWFQYAQALDVAAGRGRGFGSGRQRAIHEWMRHADLPLQMVKYRQRNGWTWSDLLIMARPRVGEWHDVDQAETRGLFSWARGNPLREGERLPGLVDAFIRLQEPGLAPKAAVDIITGDLRVPWEAVPDNLINNPDVLSALAEHMPYEATVRNLARFARAGLLKPNSALQRRLVKRITAAEAIRRARAHPVQLLDARLVHESGGRAGRSQGDPYAPNQAILAALETAFYEAFENVDPADKRFMLAVDVSGSMSTGTVAGSAAITPWMAAAVMAMTTHRREPASFMTAFADNLTPVQGVTANSSLDGVVQAFRRFGYGWGATNIAASIDYAIRHGVEIDEFVIITDNEPNSGRHPSLALEDYRQRTGIDARLAVMATTATRYSVADPADPRQLDVVGFDTAAPRIVADHARGAV